MTDFFYSVVGTEPRIRQELGLQYGPSSVAWVSRDKLIDLYLHTYAPPGSTKSVLRLTFGYDPDYYFGFTPRDQNMHADTRKWVSLFFAAIDPCSITSTLAREAIDPPSQWDVWWFLASRRFSP